jgi:hypothetical protein
MVLHSEFPQAYVFGETTLEYVNTYELCQGGPEVGVLKIDGGVVHQVHKFGGPLLYDSGVVYLPLFNRGIFIDDFKLAVIEVKAQQLKVSRFSEDLILLDKIQGDAVYYFNDLANATRKMVSISSASWKTYPLYS